MPAMVVSPLTWKSVILNLYLFWTYNYSVVIIKSVSDKDLVVIVYKTLKGVKTKLAATKLGKPTETKLNKVKTNYTSAK